MDMSYRDSNLIFYITVTVLLAAGTAILRGLWNTPKGKARRAGAILPPGPKRDFLIGNLRTFPKTRWYEVFSDWQKEYGASKSIYRSHHDNYSNPRIYLQTGDMIYTDLITHQMLIVNKLEIIEELLEKRSSIYSGRSSSTMMTKV
jgi:hypothetical protein